MRENEFLRSRRNWKVIAFLRKVYLLNDLRLTICLFILFKKKFLEIEE